MKQYTLLALISVVTAVITDFTLMTKLILNKKFWVFCAVMFVLMFLVDGYLTWRPIVIYNDDFYLGIKLFTIPIEDFLFGFSLMTLNISIWEFMTRKYSKSKSLIG